MGKIICVGLAKTGITSLIAALKLQGYKAQKAYGSIPERFDAIGDNLAAAQFKQLDKQFPRSRFILTIRDIKQWLKSWECHDAKLQQRSGLPNWAKHGRSRVFGQIEFNRSVWEETYHRHLSEVVSHFAGRGDLLIFNPCAGDGWGQLCKFLDKPVPTVPFPWSNPGVCFLFHCYQDSALVKRLVSQLQTHYPSAEKICIFDGDRDPDLQEWLRSHRITIIEGERLKPAVHGCAWLERMLRVYIENSSARRLIKLDGDTFLNHPFCSFPDGEIAGTINQNLEAGQPFPRGGCVLFQRSTIQKILVSGLLGDPRYLRSTYRYIPPGRASNEQLSCADRVTADLIQRLHITPVEWPEIYIQGREPLPPDVAHYSAVHPVY